MKTKNYQQKRTWWILLPIWLAFTITICEPAYCRPMLKEGKTWNYQLEEYYYDEAHPEQGSQLRKIFYSEKLEGDTLIGGTTYFKMYRTTEENRKLTDLFWREEEGRVYAYSSLAGTETLRYDFNLTVGEEVVIGGDIPVILNDIETIQVNGNGFVYFCVGLWGSTSERNIWVEGVGTPYGLSHCYGYEISNGQQITMLSCYEDGRCIFSCEDFDKLSAVTASVKSMKYIHNESVYDLQGRRLSNSKWSNSQMLKGLYIQNGRKVVVK